LLIGTRTWRHYFDRRESIVSSLDLLHLFIFVFFWLGVVRMTLRPFWLVVRVMHAGKTLFVVHFCVEVMATVVHSVCDCGILFHAKRHEDEGF
jgi:hypothetical protein